ncbi:MAG: helix-turn-helix transcriptional regulator [Kiritimatiellaeota bacterium]|nr:helix-turn-helix transcriptional regulator [Kiritimatiellota bacterium]
MNPGHSISERLKDRRQELGLSLSELARRAGTSAATLSRYENGWTRFETYTLRKLAAALDCELLIEWRPRTPRRSAKPVRAAVVQRLARLFWDHPLTAKDLATHPTWVCERVLEYGALDDVRELQAWFGKEEFLRTVAQAARLSPRTAGFWKTLLEREGRACTKKFSRNTAWNY